MKKSMMRSIVGLMLPALFIAFLVACGGGGGDGEGDGPTYHL